MEHRKRIPVIEVRGKLATSNLNVPSSSQNFVQRTAPRDTSSDDLKLKLKLIELLTNNDGDHETMTNEKASKALKKLLSNTEDASSENETILNWLEQKSEKKKKPKMDISKLIKALNEAAESKTEEDEIEKELKQLQQAINNLRPKDEFQVGKLDDLNSKNIGEDNFQAALNKLLNKKPSNQKPSSSNDAVKTHSFTPEQLLELQELINNQNTISSGINPYTATRPNTVFPQDSYPPFLPYNYRYSTPMARPINLDSYWPQSWPDLNTNYKFNPDFLSGPNINPLSPTYSQNDHNYPPFGYANFLKFGPFGINETPNYKISYNYSPGNDHNPFPNGIGQNQYLDTANPWKFDVNNGMGPDNQLDDGGEGNAGKSYRFFPDPKPNYGDNDERRETSPKSFIGSGLDEPYNHDEIANEYNDQVISDLSSQIQNLETVIQGLNNPNDMETKYDQNAIWNLEHKISNLKGVINSLKSSPSNGSPGYNFNELPANMKPNDIKQNPPYQNLNSLYSLTSQLGPKKDQYSISPTIYKNVNPSQINQQHRNNIISSLLPDETSGKEYLPLNRKTIEGKIRRKKRNIDYREQLPEFLNQKYQPQLHFNISTAQFENPNGLDPDVSHVVDIFKKYVMDDIEKQEQFASGIPRSNTYNDLQHKLNQLKAQLELQKKGNNYFPRHFDINEKTFNKPQDILEKLILKILDKVIGITPSIMKRLFGNLVSNIGNSYVDYNSPLQKIFSNIGASGYFPIIMIKVLETTGTVIQYMRKNRFVTQIGIPGISLALVAGVVLFLIYFYQGDHSYNLITYSDQNGYLNNHDNYQDSYNINRYPERQRKNMDSDASNSIPYFSYYDYSPVNHFVKKSY
ncbi:uncharacterized protein LOC143195457 [Rhynchophorus ferrugineus]|uniref:uncharacterized protein LOC143195457 n=1 Tax=Rhynchophorus ferrugineus TaxID=354439 RepID=UPI003FCCAAF6